jgi:putative transposase
MIPTFHAFNKHAPVEVYHRNLPHWRQEGATYFTTFRLADSIPRALFAQWNHERKIWLEANGVLESMGKSDRATAYTKIDEKRRKHFERDNARRLFRELDQCHGSCLFEHEACRAILREAMFHFDGERYGTGDFVIMPNHVHWIIQPLEGHALEDILQSIKRFSSVQLAKQGLCAGGRLWQSESHDHIIRDREELARIREYIKMNPKKAELRDDQYSLYMAGWRND